jgi:trans-feruloyl-CoA hydratase/vanillin synthase
MPENAYDYSTIRVDVEDRIGWVTLNRPDKRNSMSPTLNAEMVDALDKIETDTDIGVVVLTGAGDSFSAGMDLKEYFKDTESLPPAVVAQIRRGFVEWSWRRLLYYAKPTIAMVNGWCFGGAFTPLVSCDLAIAADEAQFGLSEINWGIIPGGNVTRAVAEAMGYRDSLYYIMTGEAFDGQRAREVGLVNESVPLAQLRARTTELAAKLASLNPTILGAAKNTYKRSRYLSWDEAEDYIIAKGLSAVLSDPERGARQGLRQFVDDKTYRPGLESYDRDAAAAPPGEGTR